LTSLSRGIVFASPHRVPSIAEPWRPGERASVRGRIWTVLERTPFEDCEALRLAAPGAEHTSSTCTLLVPFDRPVRVRLQRSVHVVRPRRWRRILHRLAAAARPFGALPEAARAAIEILPHQLEPAIAMLGRGAARVLVADEVGLGKTIQAGLLLQELARRRNSFRALIVGPAGLREQWSHELSARFGLPSTIAGGPWLSRIAREIPPDVNPWILPGIYISSFDFIKRPEVLRPLEDALWDALVVDEAHAATLGSDRRAAVHAVALRARRVMLLTATPHTGDALGFRALCAIGETVPGADPLMFFRRSRADLGPHVRRRTTLLPVHLSASEERMHRLLEAYSALVCGDASARSDARPRLAMIVLRKRALSSAASLAVSCRKRQALLSGTTRPAGEQQMLLPLGDEDPLEDVEPDSILAAPGLADADRERRWLAAIAGTAELAALGESKARILLRLLGRMREPAIVFTEYRDTLERLRRAIAPLHPDVAVLHGGMTPQERSAVQQEFNARGSLLLATDAASEGLNLQRRCRAVIHYELPWSPARIEQRTGRVDRIGQSRRVHEIILVAEDTAERLVLAPLTRRAVRAGKSLAGGPSSLLVLLTESRIAAAVMDGTSAGEREKDDEPDGRHTIAAPPDIRGEAVDEAARLQCQRAWSALAARGGDEARIAVTTLRGDVPGFTCVYDFSLVTEDGTAAHTEIVPVHVAEDVAPHPSTPGAMRQVVRGFLESRERVVRELVAGHMGSRVADLERRHIRALTSLASRERSMTAALPSPSQQLVQAGLFDGRAIRAKAVRTASVAALLEAAGQRLASLSTSARLEARFDLRAILVTSKRRA
jgi:superfamily II DNA or RNA helicase